DGYADAIVTKKFLDLLNEDPDDVRHSILVAPVKADFIDKYKTNPVFMIKFGDTNSQDTDIRYNNIPLFRLSEVYLNAAEAAVKVGEQDKAYTYLDAIVNRANPTKHAASPVTLEAVLKERRKELVGEGHRFFDAMRNNETIVRYTSTADQGWQQALTEEARSFNRDFYKTLLPVPEYEMNANPEMKQNPGY
ncbi:MAG TPA: RagB/SusD family nutrient uptake outer membrane protein, partial [Candidatus Phocaeicola gallinarum]|nr:RagB/SusD family nutrient uptake outer membrane protein [Candidatus Phocaeicola gallinarum]